MVGNESWVLDLDFHVFETEVQIMMDLISKRTKIWVRITTGKDFHLSSLFWKRESKTTKDCRLEEHGVYSGKRSKEFGLGNLDGAKLKTRSTVMCIRPTWMTHPNTMLELKKKFIMKFISFSL